MGAYTAYLHRPAVLMLNNQITLNKLFAQPIEDIVTREYV